MRRRALVALIGMLLVQTLVPAVAYSAPGSEPAPVRSLEMTMPPGMDTTPTTGDPSTLPVPVVRVAGNDRFATAVAASGSFFETGTAESVVLANGFSFPDSLAAAGLAGVVGGPVLLTRVDGIPSSTSAELKRLGARKVYLIGSTGVISAAVENSLKAAGYSVDRSWGQTRYGTAAAVARKIAQIAGTVEEALVVSGEVPWDGLSASPYAYSQTYPILYVNGSGVPSDTAKVIADLKIRNTTTLGSTMVVPKAVFDKLVALTPSAEDTRVAGETRFATSHAIAHFALQQGWATAEHPGVAAGDVSFADALVAGPIAGANGSVLLLTTMNSVPEPIAHFFTNHKAETKHVAGYGSTMVLSDAVLQKIGSLVN